MSEVETLAEILRSAPPTHNGREWLPMTPDQLAAWLVTRGVRTA